MLNATPTRFPGAIPFFMFEPADMWMMANVLASSSYAGCFGSTICTDLKRITTEYPAKI
jgi:hypothetical protein